MKHLTNKYDKYHSCDKSYFLFQYPLVKAVNLFKNEKLLTAKRVNKYPAHTNYLGITRMPKQFVSRASRKAIKNKLQIRP